MRISYNSRGLTMSLPPVILQFTWEISEETSRENMEAKLLPQPIPIPRRASEQWGEESEVRQEETVRMSLYPRPPINETFDIPCKLLLLSTKTQSFIHNFYRKCFTVSHRPTINLVKLGKKLSLYQLGFEGSGISELATDRSLLPGKEGVAP